MNLTIWLKPNVFHIHRHTKERKKINEKEKEIKQKTWILSASSLSIREIISRSWYLGFFWKKFFSCSVAWARIRFSFCETWMAGDAGRGDNTPLSSYFPCCSPSLCCSLSRCQCATSLPEIKCDSAISRHHVCVMNFHCHRDPHGVDTMQSSQTKHTHTHTCAQAIE